MASHFDAAATFFNQMGSKEADFREKRKSFRIVPKCFLPKELNEVVNWVYKQEVTRLIKEIWTNKQFQGF